MSEFVEMPVVTGRGKALTVIAFTKVAADDVVDFGLERHVWRLHQGYVLCRDPNCYHADRRFLHRLLLRLGADDGEWYADHINRDKLDNRRSNLRIVSRAENNQNLPPRTDAISQHRGVSWVTARNCWLARVYVNGKTHNRYCATEAQAAEAAAELRRLHMPFSEEAAA